MTFFIREAAARDAAGIHRMHLASIRQICSKDYTSTQINAWTSTPHPEGYVESMECGERMFVAVDNGKVIGYSSVCEDEICAVFVHPYHVGRGVGKSLLERVEQEAVDEGFSVVRLNSTLTARKFYQKYGWVVVKEVKHQLRNGCRIPCIGMEKTL